MERSSLGETCFRTWCLPSISWITDRQRSRPTRSDGLPANMNCNWRTDRPDFEVFPASDCRGLRVEVVVPIIRSQTGVEWVGRQGDNIRCQPVNRAKHVDPLLPILHCGGCMWLYVNVDITRESRSGRGSAPDDGLNRPSRFVPFPRTLHARHRLPGFIERQV